MVIIDLQPLAAIIVSLEVYALIYPAYILLLVIIVVLASPSAVSPDN